jgi:hypothetical protein
MRDGGVDRTASCGLRIMGLRLVLAEDSIGYELCGEYGPGHLLRREGGGEGAYDRLFRRLWTDGILFSPLPSGERFDNQPARQPHDHRLDLASQASADLGQHVSVPSESALRRAVVHDTDRSSRRILKPPNIPPFRI